MLGTQAKGPARGRPFVSLQTSSRSPRPLPYRTRPGFEGGTAISANYFFFFFFFAMMKSSMFEPADRALEPVSENPARIRFSVYAAGAASATCFFKKLLIFQKLNERSCID
jgi:hypothetical protein